MKVDWGKIVTNALSTLVAAMFVGAFAIIWNGVMTFDDRIKETETGLMATIDVMSKNMELLSQEYNHLNNTINRLARKKYRDEETEKGIMDTVITQSSNFKKDNIKEQIDIRQQTIRKH